VSLANNANFAAYKGDEFAEGISVFAVGCSELVTLVERGKLYGPLAERAVREALQPLLMEDADVIVLGCNHFPALRSVIENVTANQVQILNLLPPPR
jgi:glutamate racemase